MVQGDTNAPVPRRSPHNLRRKQETSNYPVRNFILLERHKTAPIGHRSLVYVSVCLLSGIIIGVTLCHYSEPCYQCNPVPGVQPGQTSGVNMNLLRQTLTLVDM